MTLIEKLKKANEQNPYALLAQLWQLTDTEQTTVYEHFKYNLADWIDLTVMAEDPDYPGNLRRFALFPAQREQLIAQIEPLTQADSPPSTVFAWEKARRVGWTNTILACLLHAAIFWNRSSLIACKNMDGVDRPGDLQNSLLPRVRLMLEYQPPFLLDEHRSKEGSIEINGAILRGLPVGSVAAATKLGRGGRVRFAFFDEAGFWDSRALELAYASVSATAKVRLVVSTSPLSSQHFFARLVDGSVAPSVQGSFIPFSANPSNDQKYLNELIATNDSEVIDREIFGKRGLKSQSIIKEYNSSCFFNPQGNQWSMEDALIKEHIIKPGFLFVSYDGGAGSNHIAAIVGYRSLDGSRDLLLWEESASGKSLVLMAEELELRLTKLALAFPALEEMRLYGDPALLIYGDHRELERVHGLPVNLLDSLKAGDPNAYKNRKMRRLRILQRKFRAQGEPNVYVLGNCELTKSGIAEGSYRWLALPGGIITQEIEQVHPVTDLIDAYSYFLLENDWWQS